MPSAPAPVDYTDLFLSEDAPPEKFLEARRSIHCSIERRSALEKLLEDFDSTVAKKLSNDNKSATRRGTLLYTLGRVEEAIPLFEQARSSRERSYFLGVSYLDVGRYAEAVPVLKDALDADSSDPLAAAALAEAHLRTGAFDAAETLLERHLKKNAENADLLHVQALWYDLQGYRDEAQQRYERALEAEPGHSRSLFRLAYLHDLHGEDARALELYEQLRKNRPLHVNTMINLGLMYEDLGEFEKADECYTAVLEYFPNHPRARLYHRDATASLSMYYDEEAARRQAKLQQVLQQPLAEITFSQRVRNALVKLGANTLGDLVAKTEEELLELPNFGKTSLREVKEFLSAKGLAFSSGVPGAPVMPGQPPGEATPEVKARPLADFEWSGRIRKVYEKLGVVTIGDLLKYSEADLLKSRNLGSTSIKEIRQKLGSLGVAMRPQ